MVAALARADEDDLQGLVQAQAGWCWRGAQAQWQCAGSHQAVAVRLEAHAEVVVEDVDVRRSSSSKRTSVPGAA